MITINSLTPKDVGRWVVYQPAAHHRERGRIKSYNDIVVFVVFQCDDHWDDYLQYIPQATHPRDLEFE